MSKGKGQQAMEHNWSPLEFQLPDGKDALQTAQKCYQSKIQSKHQGNLQAKEIDLASVPGMVDSITKWLQELKGMVRSITWFKDHSLVFTDNSQLGAKKIVVTEEEKAGFLQKVYRSYLQSVIDHINGRMESTDFLSSMPVLIHIICPILKNNYGEEKIRILIDFYGIAQKAYFDGDEAFSQPDIDPDYTEAEWMLFQWLIFRKCRDKFLANCAFLLDRQ